MYKITDKVLLSVIKKLKTCKRDVLKDFFFKGKNKPNFFCRDFIHHCYLNSVCKYFLITTYFINNYDYGASIYDVYYYNNNIPIFSIICLDNYLCIYIIDKNFTNTKNKKIKKFIHDNLTKIDINKLNFVFLKLGIDFNDINKVDIIKKIIKKITKCPFIYIDVNFRECSNINYMKKIFDVLKNISIKYNNIFFITIFEYKYCNLSSKDCNDFTIQLYNSSIAKKHWLYNELLYIFIKKII